MATADSEVQEQLAEAQRQNAELEKKVQKLLEEQEEYKQESLRLRQQLETAVSFLERENNAQQQVVVLTEQVLTQEARFADLTRNLEEQVQKRESMERKMRAMERGLLHFHNASPSPSEEQLRAEVDMLRKAVEELKCTVFDHATIGRSASSSPSSTPPPSSSSSPPSSSEPTVDAEKVTPDNATSSTSCAQSDETAPSM